MTKTSSGILGALAVMAATSGAYAVDTSASLFGIPVGQPLNVVACEIFNSKLGYSKAVQSDALCSYQKSPSQSTDTEIDIYFPKAGHPSFVPGAFDSFKATVRDGIVQKIKVYTTGLSSQDEVLGMLTEKYGKPTASINHEAQNLMGAKFNTVEAHWAVGPAMINFVGAIAIDGGYVEVETLDQVNRDHEELNKSKGPPL